MRIYMLILTVLLMAGCDVNLLDQSENINANSNNETTTTTTTTTTNSNNREELLLLRGINPDTGEPIPMSVQDL